MDGLRRTSKPERRARTDGKTDGRETERDTSSHVEKKISPLFKLTSAARSRALRKTVFFFFLQ